MRRAMVLGVRHSLRVPALKKPMRAWNLSPVQARVPEADRLVLKGAWGGLCGWGKEAADLAALAAGMGGEALAKVLTDLAAGDRAMVDAVPAGIAVKALGAFVSACAARIGQRDGCPAGGGDGDELVLAV